MMRRRPRQAGFTPIEVMAALVILGGALLVLLDTHFRSLQLHQDTRDALLMDGFVEWAVGMAEAQTLAGELEDAGDFGKQYEGYRYAYHASPIEALEGVALYSVTVAVRGPDEERTLELLVYGLGEPPGTGGPRTGA